MADFRSIQPDEAERLVREGAVRVLDVRQPEEYERLGHIPGAILLPMDLLPSAPATLPAEGKPWLVYCEHGVRSAAAARFLAQAGFAGLLNLAGGLSRWRGPRDHAPGDPFAAGPSSWLVECADLLPRGGRTLDLACGRGRHALLLAAAGFGVRAVDRDADAIAALSGVARRFGMPLEAEAIDLEACAAVDLGSAAYDLVVVFRYLHRPLFPAIRSALRPGGLLLYETYTTAQAARGKPTNPHFLLEPGELERLAAPLAIVRRREGEFDGAWVSAVAARRGGAPGGGERVSSS